MLSQEVRTARQVVEDYNKFNQNTIKGIAKRCPVTKAIFYETIAVDLNAQQFVKKYENEAKKKKQEKHLGRQLMNAPKKLNAPKVANVKPVKVKKERVYVTGTTQERAEMMKLAYELHLKGTPIENIGLKIGRNQNTARKMIDEYTKKNKIDNFVFSTRTVYILLKQGLNKNEISERLNLNPKTVAYHFQKIKKECPETVIKKLPKKPFFTHTTESIQRLISDGKNIDEISDIMNMKKTSILNNIYRYEIKMGTYVNKLKTDTKEKVKTLLASGLNRNQVAKELNIDWQSVQYHVEQLNKVS